MEEGEEEEVARPPGRPAARRRPGRFALGCQMRGIYQILLLHEIRTTFLEWVRVLIRTNSFRIIANTFKSVIKGKQTTQL